MSNELVRGKDKVATTGQKRNKYHMVSFGGSVKTNVDRAFLMLFKKKFLLPTTYKKFYGETQP